MRLIVLFFGAVAILAASPVSAQDRWMYVSTTVSDADWYIDTENYLAGRPTSTSAQMWIKIDHSRDASVRHRTSMGHYTVNCVSRTYRQNSSITYDAIGKVVSQRDAPTYTPYSRVVPESILEAAVNMLCA